MKIFLKCFMFVLCLSFIIHNSAFILAQEKLNLAVAEFEARNVSAMEAAAISDFVRTELVKIGAFNVLERKNMEHLLTEQKFQMTGCTTQECAVQMGRLLNCQKVIIGTLTNIAGIWYITGSVLDVENGKIEISERVQTVSATELASKSDELARRLGEILVKGKVSGVTLQGTGQVEENKIEGKAMRGWLGVTLSTGEISEVTQEKLGLPDNEGALLIYVFSDSPAKKAGLSSGDVIVKFDDRKVSTPYELLKMVRQTLPNKKVNLIFYRSKEQKVTEVVIGEKPPEETLTKMLQSQEVLDKEYASSAGLFALLSLGIFIWIIAH